MYDLNIDPGIKRTAVHEPFVSLEILHKKSFHILPVNIILFKEIKSQLFKSALSNFTSAGIGLLSKLVIFKVNRNNFFIGTLKLHHEYVQKRNHLVSPPD